MFEIFRNKNLDLSIFSVYGHGARNREDFKRNKAFSVYDLYDHVLAKEPLPRGL